MYRLRDGNAKDALCPRVSCGNDARLESHCRGEDLEILFDGHPRTFHPSP